MERIQQILKNVVFREAYQKNGQMEQNRMFCRHDLEHCLDVARIAWIWNLEKGLGIEKELIYATALLHDIGRYRQYEDGTPHEQAGAEQAGPILKACGFSEAETEQIVAAIRTHRKLEETECSVLNELILRADKRSRNCMFCHAAEQCNWSEEKKNNDITV